VKLGSCRISVKSRSANNSTQPLPRAEELNRLGRSKRRDDYRVVILAPDDWLHGTPSKEIQVNISVVLVVAAVIGLLVTLLVIIIVLAGVYLFRRRGNPLERERKSE
jgi:hypothetical protein